MKYNPNEVSELRPDYLGYIFWEPSKRYFDRSISDNLSGPKRVGVFVNATPEDIILKVYEHNLDAIQLHGSENPGYCNNLRKLIGTQHSPGIEMIKAFAIDEDFDFESLNEYEAACDFFLFDTKGDLPGGTGHQFNWQLLSNYKLNKPYFLSGGIRPTDAESVSSFLKRPEAEYCYAIDVNSGFETEPGLKDVEALESFIKKLGI